MRPRAILILCEGVTEKLYFESVIGHKRIPGVQIEIFEKEGQHKALIKKCVARRRQYAEALEIDEKEIEVWAVCDKDSLKKGYQKLKRFADSNSVMLAFSDPQFETYLVQHFEHRRVTGKGKDLERLLSDYIGEEYNKTDLTWFDEMIDQEPARLGFAISNAEKLDNHARSPFLTVQKLTARLLELAK